MNYYHIPVFYYTCKCGNVGLPDGCWIDGTDALVEGEWVWTTTGKAITTDDYQKWFPGEPNSNGKGEDCMDLLHHENYNWNDESCEVMNNFLCETRYAGLASLWMSNVIANTKRFRKEL